MMTATSTFFVLHKPYMRIIFLLKQFFKIFTSEKNLDFSGKLPSEGLELVILLHTQQK